MTIKRLRIAFDVDVEVLAAVLAANNCGMHVQLAGFDEQNSAVENQAVAQLEKPRRGAIRDTVIRYMQQNRGPHHVNDLKDVMVKNGGSPKSISNAVFILKRNGLIRGTSHGMYNLTKAGHRFHV